ncbi:hypothetical protein VFPBJ_10895 [Purpureocillium lilacinum]|uniref:Uncharacterized protein n=1 Tax=Purpureocillium lilacinum TaxID=33203 RepID=A0A179FWE3_PURLI|nr:hypothetical protein VFPBJ_10895 [Purpureocillium lilacinum]
MHPHPSIHLPPHPHPPSKRQARTHAHTRGPADRPTPHPSVSHPGSQTGQTRCPLAKRAGPWPYYVWPRAAGYERPVIPPTQPP